MGYIAKGSITLDNVNDAYSVSLSRQSCVIRADFDGSNPKIEEANTTVKVYRGEREVAFDCKLDNTITNAKCEPYDGRKRYVITITSVSEDVLEGTIPIIVTTDDGFETTVQFSYSIVREATMLDWIKDWEGNKTKVGSTYIMTPKIFIGKKSNYESYAEGGENEVASILNIPGLTGVYIGPDFNSTGIYGYKNSVEIFHLNNDGGMIAGWTIDSQGIQSKDGLLSIQSDGAIFAKDSESNKIWEITSSGTATFAKGNAKFLADGSAEFAGKITSTDGLIAGWIISQTQIHKDNIYLASEDNAMGIARDIALEGISTQEGFFLNGVKTCGGVAIHYTSESDWGLIGYSAGELAGKKSKQIFALGSTNMVAGWQFDDNALWSGTKENTNGIYTTNGITLGSNGLRSTQWRFEGDGSGALAGGNVVWDTEGNLEISGKITSTSGSIGGITIKESSIGTDSYSLNADGSGSLAGGNVVWDTEGNLEISGKITSTSGSIGGVAISSNSIGTDTYSLNADGSGSLAGGNVIWNAEGDLSMTGKVTATSGKIGNFELHNSNLRAQDNSGNTIAINNNEICFREGSYTNDKSYLRFWKNYGWSITWHNSMYSDAGTQDVSIGQAKDDYTSFGVYLSNVYTDTGGSERQRRCNLTCSGFSVTDGYTSSSSGGTVTSLMGYASPGGFVGINADDGMCMVGYNEKTHETYIKFIYLPSVDAENNNDATYKTLESGQVYEHNGYLKIK